MDDVTDKILSGYKPEMTENERSEIVEDKFCIGYSCRKAKQQLRGKSRGTLLRKSVFPVYLWNLYRRSPCWGSSFIDWQIWGDTDNWMWPRHTGDFQFSVYMQGKDNKPAAYSKENIPYKPKKFFSISLNGVKKETSLWFMAYPGRTQEYLMSDAVKYIAGISNPNKINLRTMRLDIQKRCPKVQKSE